MKSDAFSKQTYDIFVIGGGVNGCGIARDAAGRGLSVALAEKNDLASGTSSASTNLFHGGLRYLEYFELGLVRKSLKERDILLANMPHISWPMRFVLPIHKDMRFEGQTPASRLLGLFMPWMKGRRPAWLIRFGLFIYDHLNFGGRLPKTGTLDLTITPEGTPLNPKLTKAFEYSDCWVDDARLVALSARSAAALGADIIVGAEVVKAERHDGVWVITIGHGKAARSVRAKILINAGGPWVEQVLRGVTKLEPHAGIRLVRGSHIVTKRLYDHDKCYFFQGTDGRIIFAIPYQNDFTLIGTTDAEHDDLAARPVATKTEQAYLCAFASEYFAKPVTEDQVVWSYSGVRPLFDDGAASASAATRDYVLSLNDNGPPMLSVFGGKITTYRVLAEEALAKVSPYFTEMKPSWTAFAPLPGGGFPADGVQDLTTSLMSGYPYLNANWAGRLIKAYGTDAAEMLGSAISESDLGHSFGATLTEREVRWLVKHEFARSADDIVWRRTKLGLKMTQDEIETLDDWLKVKSE
jgi:glycerol-3-phosphate dehydrogenase